ncbi:DUF3566 domain-containing protein [Kribbia dieselivorans]|uniref:DUF3566 domain-containing protein n=1 Tax=Kribbia dieselivorans TaxID=331526 RepID=UPI0008383003|nr:DUF3566 domain-containing protein [Kribbia dieselivorans]
MSTTGEHGTAMRGASGSAANPAPTRTQPAQATRPATPRSRPAVRRVKLLVSRIDPWSALKISFLISVALGIAMVVMVAVLWTLLQGMGVFDQVSRMIGSIAGSSEKPFDIMDILGFGRVLSLTIVIAVVDVVLMTALATLGAFLYNVCASLVGGLQLTLTDD